MYRNLTKQIRHFRLTDNSSWLNFQVASLYHSGSAYYGYRPKLVQDWKIPSHHLSARQSNRNLRALIEAYQSHGHRKASVNSIELSKVENVPELDALRYGLELSHKLPFLEGLVGFSDARLENIGDLIAKLDETYCQKVSAEFSFIESECEREWFAENFEKLLDEKLSITKEEKIKLATELLQFQEFDRFMNIKLPSIKRYGGEGSESTVAFFRKLLNLSGSEEIDTIVLGMPHRGKLNALVTLFQQRPAKIFRKYRGLPEFGNDVVAMMDITNHYNVSEDFDVGDNKKVHLTMLHNPSHLEAVNPVTMGKTRSKQQSLRDGAFNDDNAKEFGSEVINIQLHGDAAFSGQGMNQECLMLAYTPNFDIGGTIHLVINNQIGFTTPGDRGRSSRYSTDVAKSINAPIIHVDGNDPELVWLVTKLAFQYQRKFRKDIFIDMNCFRRLGHNELDDPTVTNPLMYKMIRDMKSVPDTYAQKMIDEGFMAKQEIDDIVKKQFDYYNSELQNVEQYQPEKSYFMKQWEGFVQAPNNLTVWDTGVDWSLLSYIGRQSVYYPKEFSIHPHIKKTFVNSRLKKLADGNAIDWATAEAFGVGSLMYQGHNVRISGEDVGRGTFAQRHAMLVDQETNEVVVPLNSMKGGLGGKYEVANSILSEEAVLGYEYGMSIDNPDNLIIWESQFGDFFNGAQILIDTFIASGETKWMRCSGLVILLPHGYDGAASEHSSSRMERFLQMTDSKETVPDGDDVNMHIIFPTTPAQYFHALRRQIIRNFRKPLVIIGPKTMLRMSEATSPYQDFQPGTNFKNVLPDTTVDPKNVKRVLLCSGKHYYSLVNERKTKNIQDTAIIRIESLCPFPVYDIHHELDKYKNAKTFIWSQEEHRNMGAWNFIHPRFENTCGRRIKYCGRNEAGTPATGVSSIHQKESTYVASQPFIM
ncbi:CLUMA_CG004838, isoform A [Clunio marinus]|uniref:CLUMA_CG004838, isoform A n=1 Tax=Clunio marinus TaxID=568069 RepID=A0A1J1HYE3_9DIPT|nr:CLUMA_CG004838, isoform A [Clunio marinus]